MERLCAALATLIGLSAPAQASEDHLWSSTCDPAAVESSQAEAPDMLDPRLRGVALADLDVPEGRMLADFLRMKGVMPLAEILSTSIVELRPTRVVVDVVGRAPRFADTDDRSHKHGRVGLIRVTVPVASAEGLCDVGIPRVEWEKSLTELDLRYRVSIADWIGVVEDTRLGFRRLFPLGGGGIDRGVREVGVVTSLTPTILDGLLEKDYAWRELHSPWYFRNKPYLPISFGRTLTRKDGTSYKVYAESKVAFHIWQDKGFERGFFSHGCIRMRTEDLAELAAFVFGAPAPIPVTLRVPAFGDAHHPYPMDTVKYWQLKNYGTVDKPRIRIKYMLQEMELGTLPLPNPADLVPTDLEGKPLKP